MTQLTFVRHGQANSHADNAEDYDRLSPLGEQQAKWLGGHLSETEEAFDHVICGDMRRHHSTARGMGFANFAIDPRWDELDYFALATAAQEEHGIPFETDNQAFANNAPKIMALWEADKLEAVPERFSSFSGRIQDALAESCAQGGRVLVVTSGGVISVVVRRAMGLDQANWVKSMLHIRNSSVHRFEYLREDVHLTGYNALPHLDAPDRAFAKTFY